MNRRAAHIRFLAVLIGVAGMILAAGCHLTPIMPKDRSAPVTQPAKAVEQHLSAVSTEHAAARKNIAAVTKAPELPPALLPPLREADTHVAVAEQHTQAATTQMAVLDKAAADWAAKDLETQKQLEAAQKKINELNMAWVGPRAKRWGWTIGILAACAAFLFGVLKGPASLFPLLRVLCRTALGVGSFGLTEIHNLGHWISVKVDAWYATPAPTAATPAK